MPFGVLQVSQHLVTGPVSGQPPKLVVDTERECLASRRTVPALVERAGLERPFREQDPQHRELPPDERGVAGSGNCEEHGDDNRGAAQARRAGIAREQDGRKRGEARDDEARLAPRRARALASEDHDEGAR